MQKDEGGGRIRKEERMCLLNRAIEPGEELRFGKLHRYEELRNERARARWKKSLYISPFCTPFCLLSPRRRKRSLIGQAAAPRHRGKYTGSRDVSSRRGTQPRVCSSCWIEKRARTHAPRRAKRNSAETRKLVYVSKAHLRVTIRRAAKLFDSLRNTRRVNWLMIFHSLARYANLKIKRETKIFF